MPGTTISETEIATLDRAVELLRRLTVDADGDFNVTYGPVVVEALAVMAAVQLRAAGAGPPQPRTFLHPMR